MSGCSYHASKESIGACTNCGKLICRACNNEIDGKSYCPPCVEKLFTASKAEAQSTPALAAAKPAGQAVNPAWWLLPVFLTWAGGLAAWLVNKERNASIARYMLFSGIGMAVVQGVVGMILMVALLAPSAVTPGQNPSTATTLPPATNPAPTADTGDIATSPKAPAATQSPASLPVNQGQKPSTTTSLPTATSPSSRARTGEITTGPEVQAASQAIDSSGGTIVVNKPGDPLDGYVLDVPPGAYPDTRTFKVSYSPITKQTFGSDITPISPMISVENGGGYSDELMYVRVPVKVPAGYFAMGFIYDEKTGRLEGMPLVGMDADSITIATRHFSKSFVGMILEALLKEDIDSGFQPGIDDWQFTNDGSYIAPGGHCEGQSLTALWYYYARPDGPQACLYNRYDNNGNLPKTPGLWQDDSLGYRLCSTVQKDVTILDNYLKWDALAGKSLEWKINKWVLTDVPGISDEATRDLFAYSMQATGEPQEVGIYSNAGGGHAMICYRVTGNTLHIADPNYPGNTERKIEYVDGKFNPYNSGANREEIDAGKVKQYEKIIYEANWTIVSFDKIAARWAELKNKTIGNDKFPTSTLYYTDDKGLRQDLKDGYVTSVKMIDLNATLNNGAAGSIVVYRDGVILPFDATFKNELKPGNNLLGIWVKGKVGDDKKYIDFKYINVIYSKLSIDPSTLGGEINQQYTFTAKADFPPVGARYDWYVDGAKAQGNTSATYAASFKTEGSHEVSVKLVDSAGKEIQEAKSAVTITAAPASTPALAGDCKYISFILFPRTNCVHNFYKDDRYKSDWDTREPASYVVKETNIPITWNGLNFSGKYKGKTDSAGNRERNTLFKDYILDCTINGSVSADSKAIKQLKATMIYTSASESFTEKWEYEFTDIPLTNKIDTLQHRDPASRNLLLQYKVFDSNNPAAHGKFSATYQGKPEFYSTDLGGGKYKDNMSDGKGTCLNCMWEPGSSTVTGPINFGLKVNTLKVDGY